MHCTLGALFLLLAHFFALWGVCVIPFQVRASIDYLAHVFQKDEAGQSCIIGGIEVEGFELGTVAHSVRAFTFSQVHVNKL
jgi:hypothetical protein